MIEDSIPLLIKLLEDGNSDVKLAAIETIDELAQRGELQMDYPEPG